MYRAKHSRGFTLVEVLTGASLGSMVLLGVITTYLMLLRSGISASNYAVMEAQVRRTFEQLGSDTRMASTVATASDSVAVTLTVPRKYVTNANCVTYAYDRTNKWLYLVPGDGSAYVVPGTGSVPVGQRILINNVASVAFNRYDQASAATTLDSSTRHVQAAIVVRRATNTTETILSAAFTMRN